MNHRLGREERIPYKKYLNRAQQRAEHDEYVSYPTPIV
jgi:hypothetical protein